MSIATQKLSRPSFLAYHSDPMRPVAQSAEPVLDFWPYYEAIPDADFEGYERRGTVCNAYREGTGRFEHILVNTNDRNVFMVLIVAIDPKAVVGHHLLNLNREYGLEA